MRLRGAVTWMVAPALLTGVALVQFWQVAHHDQSSWRGVGFGMFATFDDATNRLARVTLEIDGVTVNAHVPGDLVDDLEHLLIRPAAGGVQALADELVQRRWVLDEERGQARPAADDEPGQGASAATVTIQRVEVTGGEEPFAELAPIRTARADGPTG